MTEWVTLRGVLIPTARDLFRRSVIAIILNRFQGMTLGPPVYGPYLPGQGPYGPTFCVDLSSAPWLTPEQAARFSQQGLAAWSRSRSAAGASIPRPRPRRQRTTRPGGRPGWTGSRGASTWPG